MNIADYVGARCLLSVTGAQEGVAEYRILEVSPSAQLVKLQTLSGHIIWRAVTDVQFVVENMTTGHDG